MPEIISENQQAEEIKWAEDFAKKFGYDQIVVVGRRHSGPNLMHGEWVTTYGKNVQDKEVARLMGDHLKYRVMGWQRK